MGHSSTRVGWIAAALIAVVVVFASTPSYAAVGASLVTSIADDTDTSSYNFPSSTYSNNVLYIAFTSVACASGQDCGLGVDVVAAVESVSGAGLNFTEIGTPGGVVFSTDGRRIQAWRALATSGAGTGAVTVTMDQTGTTYSPTISASMGAAMIEVTGTKTTGTNGADAIVQWPTNSASGVTSLTVNMAAFADANNRPLAFFSHRADSGTEATNHDTAEGYTELHDGPHGSVMMAHMAEWHATAANTTPSASWTSSGATGGFALELAEAGAPGVATLNQAHVRWRNDDGGEVASAAPIQVSATLDTTTTSASDVLVDSMTITPGAGDYHIWFSGSVESSATSYQYVSLYVNGVQLGHTEREIRTESSIPATSFPVAAHARVTGVGAGQAIEVRWRTTAGTATMHERTLVVHKITAADSTQASATGDTTTTSTSDVLVNSMTITPGAGDYHIWFSGSVEAAATSYQYVSLYVNGVQLTHTERQIRTEGSIPATSFPVATHASVTGVGAGQAIEVRWRTSASTATMHERTLVVSKITAATWAPLT